MISNRCRGQNSKHKHAAWGINSSTKKFATSEETAYPMGLAKLIAHCYVLALHRLQIQTPPETINDIQNKSLETLRQLRAATGIQSKSSKMPPLVRTYSQKIQAKVAKSLRKLFQRARETVVIDKDVQIPKGARLLSLQTSSFPQPGETGISEEGTTAV